MATILTAEGWNSPGRQYFISVGTNCKHVTLHSSSDDLNDEVKEQNFKLFMLDVNDISYSPTQFGLVAANDKHPNLFDITNPELDPIVLKTNNSRVSTCLEFSGQGKLAVGLEKQKNHHGLHIYDGPLQSKTYRSYLNNEHVHSAKFLSHNIVIAGTSSGVKEVDLRSKDTNYSVVTPCTNYIDVGPTENFFSSVSNDEDGNLSIFDRRNVAKPVLELANVFSGELYIKKNIVPCYRFTSWNYRELTTLHHPTRADSLLKRWDFGSYESVGDLFVSKVKDVANIGRIVSFDGCRSDQDGFYGSMVLLSLSGKVTKMPILDGDSAIRFNNYNSLLISNGNELKIQGPVAQEIEETVPEVEELAEPDMVLQADTEEPPQQQEEKEPEEPVKAFVSLTPAFEILQNDIASVMYKRALIDYNLTDLYQNSDLFSEFNKNFQNESNNYVNSNYEQLRICWKWLYHSNKNCTEGITVQNGLDISYEGIYNLWTGINEIVTDEQRRFNKQVFYKESRSKNDERGFLNTLEKCLNLIHKPGKLYVSTIHTTTNKQVQRKYCLFSCGWYITKKEFDIKIGKLMELEFYEKAAGLSVFQGDVLGAIKILSSVPDGEDQEKILKNSKLRIIAAAMMGFYNRTIDVDEEEGEPLWKEQCRKLANSLGSPYLRAIFTYLTERDWQEVLEEPALALKEKLLIALKFLPDDKLTEYLKTVTFEAIIKGSPDGIMLTGLTKKGLSLLQSYNDRYTDIQTVALISAFTVPRFFNDTRAENWIGSYCDLLNSWKLFQIRAKFNIAHRKLSKNYLYVNKNLIVNNSLELLFEETAGSKNYNPPFFLPKKQRQLYLKCIQCDNDISYLLRSKKQNYSKKVSGIQTKDKSTVTCVCGASLPKCAICLYSLGAPIRYSDAKETTSDYFRDWATFCLNCNHGMHSKHADEWFDSHRTCPVPDCNCKCTS